MTCFLTPCSTTRLKKVNEPTQAVALNYVSRIPTPTLVLLCIAFVYVWAKGLLCCLYDISVFMVRSENRKMGGVDKEWINERPVLQ